MHSIMHSQAPTDMGASSLGPSEGVKILAWGTAPPEGLSALSLPVGLHCLLSLEGEKARLELHVSAPSQVVVALGARQHNALVPAQAIDTALTLFAGDSTTVDELKRRQLFRSTTLLARLLSVLQAGRSGNTLGEDHAIAGGEDDAGDGDGGREDQEASPDVSRKRSAPALGPELHTDDESTRYQAASPASLLAGASTPRPALVSYVLPFARVDVLDFGSRKKYKVSTDRDYFANYGLLLRLVDSMDRALLLRCRAPGTYASWHESDPEPRQAYDSPHTALQTAVEHKPVRDKPTFALSRWTLSSLFNARLNLLIGASTRIHKIQFKDLVISDEALERLPQLQAVQERFCGAGAFRHAPLAATRPARSDRYDAPEPGDDAADSGEPGADADGDDDDLIVAQLFSMRHAPTKKPRAESAVAASASSVAQQPLLEVSTPLAEQRLQHEPLEPPATPPDPLVTYLIWCGRMLVMDFGDLARPFVVGRSASFELCATPGLLLALTDQHMTLMMRCYGPHKFAAWVYGEPEPSATYDTVNAVMRTVRVPPNVPSDSRIARRLLAGSFGGTTKVFSLTLNSFLTGRPLTAPTLAKNQVWVSEEGERKRARLIAGRVPVADDGPEDPSDHEEGALDAPVAVTSVLARAPAPAPAPVPYPPPPLLRDAPLRRTPIAVPPDALATFIISFGSIRILDFGDTSQAFVVLQQPKGVQHYATPGLLLALCGDAVVVMLRVLGPSDFRCWLYGTTEPSTTAPTLVGALELVALPADTQGCRLCDKIVNNRAKLRQVFGHTLNSFLVGTKLPIQTIQRNGVVLTELGIAKGHKLRVVSSKAVKKAASYEPKPLGPPSPALTRKRARIDGASDLGSDTAGPVAPTVQPVPRLVTPVMVQATQPPAHGGGAQLGDVSQAFEVEGFLVAPGMLVDADGVSLRVLGPGRFRAWPSILNEPMAVFETPADALGQLNLKEPRRFADCVGPHQHRLRALAE